MKELFSPRLSIDISVGLLAIEQVAYVLLVFFLSMALGERVIQLRASLKRWRLWAGLALVAFAILSFALIHELGVEMAPLALSIAAGFVLGVMNDVFALCFFTASLLLRPWELLPGSGLMLVIPKVLFFLSLASGFFHNFRKRDFSVIWNREIAILLFFTLWVYLSLFHSPAWRDAHADFTEHFTRSIIIFLLVVNWIRERPDLLVLSASVTWACVTIACLTVYRMIFDPVLQVASARAQLFGMIGDPNDISALLLLALPLAVYFGTAQFSNRISKGVVAVGIVSAVVWLITLTQSRGAMLALVALVTVFAWTRAKTRFQMALIVVLIAVGAVGLQATLHRSQSDLEASSLGRWSYWKAGLRMAIRNPVFGVGYQGFPRRLPEFVDGRFSEAGPRTAHSTWILLMAETGFVGFFLFAALFALALKAAWRMFPRYPDLFLSLVGYGAAISFLSHSYVLLPYLLMAIVFAASHIDLAQSGPTVIVKEWVPGL